MLVATETGDDAGVYRLSERQALVQTVDFFTPIVDDPYDYGRVAAANALSDVYAMGGRPITALCITCFPDKVLGGEVLVRIMQGAEDKVAEAGASILGGHSVSDPELKFGLAVTGLVDPARIVRNAGARPGDLLVLTKPLGTGILSSAVKKGRLGPDEARQLTETMAELNRVAGEEMARHEVHAATDVTGFGILGHARGMVRASNVAFHLGFDQLPLLPRALSLAGEGVVTRGDRTNAVLVEDVADLDPALAKPEVSILMDPQTSGGLLMAVARGDAERLVSALHGRGIAAAAVVGSVAAGPARLVVTRRVETT